MHKQYGMAKIQTCRDKFAIIIRVISIFAVFLLSIILTASWCSKSDAITAIESVNQSVPKNNGSALQNSMVVLPTANTTVEFEELFGDTKFQNGFRASWAFGSVWNPVDVAGQRKGECIGYRDIFPYRVFIIPQGEAGLFDETNKYWDFEEGAHLNFTNQYGNPVPELFEHRLVTNNKIEENTTNRLTILQYNNYGLQSTDPDRDKKLVKKVSTDKNGRISFYYNTQNEIRNAAYAYVPKFANDIWPTMLLVHNFRNLIDISKYEKVDISMKLKVNKINQLSQWPDNDSTITEAKSPSEMSVLTYFHLYPKDNPAYPNGLFVGLALFSTGEGTYNTILQEDQLGEAFYRREPTEGRLVIGQEKVITFELKSLIQEAIDKAIIQNTDGSLKSRNPDDYLINVFNIGYEAIGHWEADYELADISAKAYINPDAGAIFTASNSIGTEYTADKAFDGDPNTRWQQNWPLTNQWLEAFYPAGKTFDTVVIKTILADWSRTDAFKIQYSNDRTNWTDLASAGVIVESPRTVVMNQKVTAKYIRLFVSSATAAITVTELEFINSIEPTEITYIASNSIGTGYTADKAFDGNEGTRWQQNWPLEGQWLEAFYPAGKTFNRISLSTTLEGWCTLDGYKLQYSNDRATWTDISTEGQVTTNPKITNLTNRVTAKYIRVYIAAVGGPAAAITVNELKIENILIPVTFGTYKVSNTDKYITNITINQQNNGPTVLNFKGALTLGDGTVAVKDKIGGATTDSSTITTGSMVEVTNGAVTDTYKIIIFGDVNGNGNIGLTDLADIKLHILRSTQLTGDYFSAGDIAGKGSISISDLLAVKKSIMGIAVINQNVICRKW